MMLLKRILLGLLSYLLLFSLAHAAQTCTTITIPLSGVDINSISGTSDSNIIAVGDNTAGNGQIAIFDGTNWVRQTDPSIPNEDLNDVFVLNTSSSVVVGDDGTVLIQSGTDPATSWSALTSPTSEDITTVWAYSTNEIYVAGDNGEIYLWNGSAPWVDLSSAANASNGDDFVDSWGDANNLYFLTDEGKIFTFDRSSGDPTNSSEWSNTTPGCISGNVDINGFTSDGAGNFYLVGELTISQPGPDPDVAVIYQWDGSNCNIVYQSTVDNTELNSVSIASDGSLTAVGDDGLVLTSPDGSLSSWTATTSGTDDINSVWISNTDNIYYAADNGAVQTCAENKPHFSISHTGSTSACTAAAITITAHDDNHNINTNYTGSISLTTSSSTGDWSVNSATNTVTNNGNGSASYTFSAADNGQIILNLINSTADILSINIADNTVPEALTEFFTEDPTLTVIGPADETYLDTFSSQTYNNSDGSIDWSTSSWIETDAAGGGATGGNARIAGNELRIDTPGTSVTRAVSLSSYTSATFSFSYNANNADTGQDLAVVETSTDGTSFTALQSFDGAQSGTISQIIPITTTHIRFRITAGFTGPGERLEIDDVQITATPLASCLNTIDHIRIEHNGEGLTCDREQVTVRACLDTSCTSEYTASDVTLTLTPDGDTITFNGNTTIAYVRQSTVGLATLDASVTSTPTPINNTRCFNGATETCDMNFVDSGFRFTDGANPPNPLIIGTQIAGKASNINPGSQTIAIQAVRTDTNTGACIGVFADGSDVNVEMASQCNNPTTCFAASQVNITNNGITTAINNNPNTGVTSYSVVPLRFTTNSQAILTFSYPDVGQVSLHTRYNIPDSTGILTGNYMSGSSNLFVVTPATFVVNNILRLDDSANPANTTAIDTPYFITAGTNFKASVEAHDINGNITPNYGNEIDPEGVLLTPTLVAGLGLVNNPAITNNTIAGSEFGSTGAVTDPDGVASVINLSWPEVGIITITPTVAGSDGNNYLGAGAVTGTTSGNVGRFVPSHFDTLVTHACNTFTYSAQPFIVTVTARNTAGAITSNYRGGFAHGVTLTDASPAAIPPGVFNNNTIDTASFSSNTADNGSNFGVGSTQVANNFTYTFTDKETLPEVIEIRATDTIDTTISSSGFTEGSTEIRSGRSRVDNAYGSELIDLSVPALVESYTGNGFVINSDDTCSVVTATLTDIGTDPVTTGDGSGPTQTCIRDDDGESGTDNCSDASVLPGPALSQFASPALAGSFNLNLLGPGANNTGDIGISLVSPIWLQFDWDGDGNHDNNPSATASFGLFRGDDRIIYQREVF